MMCMNQSQKRALIRREVLQAKDLMNQLVDEKVSQAREIVETRVMNSDCFDMMIQVIDDFNAREHMFVGDYIEDVLQTDKKIEEIVMDFTEGIRDLGDSIFEEYERLAEEDIVMTLDLVMCKLDGIVTPRQVKREFDPLAEQIDVRLTENIHESINKILEQISYRIDDITYDFGYKVQIVSRFIEEHLSERKQLEKITDVRTLEKMIKNEGYKLKRQTGSHKIYEDENGKVTCIPVHGKTIDKGLAYTIQRQIR